MSDEEWMTRVGSRLEPCRVEIYHGDSTKTVYAPSLVARDMTMDELLSALETAPVAELADRAFDDTRLDLFWAVSSALARKGEEDSYAHSQEAVHRVERLFHSWEALGRQTEATKPLFSSFLRNRLAVLGGFLVRRGLSDQCFIQAASGEGVFQLHVDASAPLASPAQCPLYPPRFGPFRVCFTVYPKTDFSTFRRYVTFYINRGDFLFSVAHNESEIPVFFSYTTEVERLPNVDSTKTRLFNVSPSDHMGDVLDALQIITENTSVNPVVYLSSDAATMPHDTVERIGRKSADKLRRIVSQLEKLNGSVIYNCDIARRLYARDSKSPSPIGRVEAWRMNRLDEMVVLLQNLFDAPTTTNDVWYVENQTFVEDSLPSEYASVPPVVHAAENLDKLFWIGLNGHVKPDISPTMLNLEQGEDVLGILTLYLSAEQSEIDLAWKSIDRSFVGGAFTVEE